MGDGLLGNCIDIYPIIVKLEISGSYFNRRNANIDTLFFISSAVVHYIAHVFNAKNFSMNYNRIYKNVNAARYQNEVSILLIYYLVFYNQK